MENKTNILSKEEFVEVINKIQKIIEFDEKLHDLFYGYGCEAPEFPDLYDPLLKTLNKMFGLEDEEDKYYISDIDYFCIELDFGKKYHPGCVTEGDGTEVDLSTAEKLYDYITRGK